MLCWVVLFACTSPQKEETVEERITRLEAEYKELSGAKGTDLEIEKIQGVMGGLVTAYLEFVDASPNAAEASERLFKAGELYYANLQEPQKGIELFDRLLVNYPKSDRAPDALFQQAYIYHNHLKDNEQAEAQYRKFLELYPDHDLAPYAQFEIDNLGVPPNELLKKIQQQDSLRKATDS